MVFRIRRWISGTSWRLGQADTFVPGQHVPDAHGGITGDEARCRKRLLHLRLSESAVHAYAFEVNALRHSHGQAFTLIRGRTKVRN